MVRRFTARHISLTTQSPNSPQKAGSRN
ncbi:hypothetical protein CLIM01_09063 [Colletotrichum limetticola]|uniref:Uncharacterized protein n=1 Tax=Colletotrichum limetticola TaxID=1209924 RepID=A0ABQ9PPW3_9PEZI|nr:hypothetical protein CLIM01_09063 [Colletotrichum limetticola]